MIAAPDIPVSPPGKALHRVPPILSEPTSPALTIRSRLHSTPRNSSKHHARSLSQRRRGSKIHRRLCRFLETAGEATNVPLSFPVILHWALTTSAVLVRSLHALLGKRQLGCRGRGMLVTHGLLTICVHLSAGWVDTVKTSREQCAPGDGVWKLTGAQTPRNSPLRIPTGRPARRELDRKNC